MEGELNRRNELSKALELVSRAIDILDQAEAPADITAHLDLACVRLDEMLSQTSDQRVGAGIPSRRSDEALN